MSRWWAEHLRCLVAPVAADGATPVDPVHARTGARVGAAGDPVDPIAASLAALGRALDARAPRRGSRLHAVVGGALARHRIVPWNPSLRGDGERRLFAQHAFIEAHGEVGRGWSSAIDAARFGQDALACAVDTVLIDGLQALCESRGLRLVAVETALVVACQALRGGWLSGARAAPAPRWVLLSESAGLTVLLLDPKGQPVLVRRLPRELVERPADLPQALERLRITHGLDGPRGLLMPLGDWPAPPLPTSTWEVQGLDAAQLRAWRRLWPQADAVASTAASHRGDAAVVTRQALTA